MKVGLFGSFYPNVDRSGTFSTGLTILLSSNPKVEEIIVYGPTNCEFPPIPRDNIRLVRCWTPNNFLSLIPAIFAMLQDRHKVDTYFFNIFLTFFGRSLFLNAFGLQIPVFISLVTRKRVVTYMHNFIETQEIDKLGYKKNRLVAHIASFIEHMLGRFTTLVAPLPSMKAILNWACKLKVESVFLPYMDAILPLELQRMSKSGYRHEAHNDQSTVLLFGSWGPQKDIIRPLKVLNDLIADGHNFNVLISGSINMNFRDYETLLIELFNGLPKDRFVMKLNVPEEEIAELFSSNGPIILPYLATGGASGVMSLSNFFGKRVIAYDSPQLREIDSLLGCNAIFVNGEDENSFKSAILSAINEVKRPLSALDIQTKLNLAKLSVDKLLSIFQ